MARPEMRRRRCRQADYPRSGGVGSGRVGSGMGFGSGGREVDTATSGGKSSRAGGWRLAKIFLFVLVSESVFCGKRSWMSAMAALVSASLFWWEPGTCMVEDPRQGLFRGRGREPGCAGSQCTAKFLYPARYFVVGLVGGDPFPSGLG